MQFINFPLINFPPEDKHVLSRLGYHKKTQVTESDMADIKQNIKKAAEICFSKARACIFSIESKDEKSVTLDTGLCLKSEKLARLLKNSDEVLLMASTLGNNVSKRIETELKDGDKVFSIILDAYASQCVDHSLDYIMQSQTSCLLRQGKVLTKHRFSAGYGRLDIAYQKDFYDLLSLQELNIQLTKSTMLLPEKSVIAIAGIIKTK